MTNGDAAKAFERGMIRARDLAKAAISEGDFKTSAICIVLGSVLLEIRNGFIENQKRIDAQSKGNIVPFPANDNVS